VAKELLRRGWAPKDFKHVRPALEHLVALEVLERDRKPGRKAKWLFRKAENFEERIVMVQSCLREGDLRSQEGHRSLIPSPNSSVL
jgi:hypothetical protein